MFVTKVALYNLLKVSTPLVKDGMRVLGKHLF